MPSLYDATGRRVLFGGDYNPEQWPEETWLEDVRLMKQAGVNSVTLGVFSWAKLEPRPGAREFDWLDRLTDLMHGNGIGIVLATPTASPPPWMGQRHPETLPRGEDGSVIWYGSRQHFCPSSPVYREYAAAITEDLAARYGGHPALRMWHINNEYCTFCYCDGTARHFRRWLRERYKTLDALNEAWGTAFWSQGYDDWDEIIPPRRAQYLRNPACTLDFRRFTSDALLECYVAERDIVAAHTPQLPVTTNFMPFWTGQDAWRWAEEEDVVSVDVYPDPRDPLGGQYGAMIQDMTRSQARGPWMLMEQAAGPVNFRGVNHPKPRGLNRLWSLQAVARGADAVCYFQWRQSRQGSEKFHSAMVTHAGEQGRTYQEIKRIGADLAGIGEQVAGAGVPADVVILHDWNSWWAGGQEGRLSTGLDYPTVVRAWHRALWDAGLTTDFAHPEHDLSAYRLVVVPHLYLLTDAAVDNLVGHVRGGGTLVSGFLTGTADGDDRIRPGGMDERLRDLFGIATVHEWWPLEPGETVPCENVAGDGTGAFHGTVWSEDWRSPPPRRSASTTAVNSPACPPSCAGAAPGTSRRSPTPRRCATCSHGPPTTPGSGPCCRTGRRDWRPYAGETCSSCSTTPPDPSPSPCRDTTGTCSPATRPVARCDSTATAWPY
ncbi:beta-galactosidase [Streptomyces pristinaespiralis ATCC 25486]|uniref:Beta-galactosidase n=1 Tax=Streptomyces pristinaespiralis (strain ATCC 25486 / DSM 40338 / CBS 914.69 / JCM 4507 / KCC S-0507 / NBRC 13074 / NRRL 2958 / 5647) TaxID=457429 RepID=B5HAP0_STRE2|nr:beta-galactosidase [Streptomyces pristinaespiralis ATCC 25486]